MQRFTFFFIYIFVSGQADSKVRLNSEQNEKLVI